MSDARWMNSKAIAHYICVKPSTLARLVREKRIPGGCERHGRSGLWWDANVIDEKIRSGPASVRRNGKPENLLVKSVSDILSTAQPRQQSGSGIYFLIRDGNVVYVGQSVDVVARISQHRSVKDFDSWSWVPCPVSELNKTEFAYIQALKPILNVALTRGWRVA